MIEAPPTVHYDSAYARLIADRGCMDAEIAMLFTDANGAELVNNSIILDGVLAGLSAQDIADVLAARDLSLHRHQEIVFVPYLAWITHEDAKLDGWHVYWFLGFPMHQGLMGLRDAVAHIHAHYPQFCEQTQSA